MPPRREQRDELATPRSSLSGFLQPALPSVGRAINSGRRISMAPQGGQLCDRNVRDDFTQPSNSPDHGIEPIGRAIDRAVPFPAECHHLGFQLVEAATMQHAALLIQKADRLGPHRLAARCRDLLDSYHVRVAPAALMHAFGGLLDHFGRHVAPKLISTTTSSASKSSWHFTAASPHCAGDPVVVRSASTANLPSFNNADATMPTSSPPPDGSTPTVTCSIMSSGTSLWISRSSLNSAFCGSRIIAPCSS